MHTSTATSIPLALLMFWLAPATLAWSQPPQDEFPQRLADPPAPDPRPTAPAGPLFFLTPTASLGIALALGDPAKDKPILGGHLGLSLYPLPRLAPLFLSATLRLERQTEVEGNPVDFLPTARLGVSWLPGDPSQDYLHILLPYAQVYATLSRRLPRTYKTDLGRRLGRPGAWRAMLGISSPMFGSASAFMCAQGVPLPNTLELGVERDDERQETDVIVTISISI